MAGSAVGIFFAACGLSLLLTALLRSLAPRVGLTDRPDGHRKLHRRATPVGGGLAIYTATLIVTALVLLLPTPLRNHLWGGVPDLFWLFVAGAVIVAVGVIDDKLRLRGRQKLLGQCIAAGVLIGSGMVVEKFSFFGWEVELGLLAIPFTLFWLLGAINSLNLLDGIDGLATTVGIILAGTIGIMAMMIVRLEVAIVAMIFTGALVGFLRFNFPPASIFLGDSGSMLIGLVVGVLAIQGSLKGPGTVLLAAPVAIWAIPILDSGAAILRRKLTGRSIYTADHGHLHHRLMELLGSNRKVLAVLAICCLATSVAALLSVFWKSDLIACLAFIAIIVIFLTTGVFGRVELLLLGTRLGKIGRSLLPGSSNSSRVGSLVTVRLQGSRQWELLWETFVERAKKLNLVEIHMTVNLPFAKEGYHASWERPAAYERENCWRMEVPLMVGGRPAGYFVIVGQAGRDYVCRELQQVLSLAEPFERQLYALSDASARAAAAQQTVLPADAGSQPSQAVVYSTPPRG